MIDSFLVEVRKSSDLQTKLMGCPSPEAFVETAASVGISLNLSEVKDWQARRLEELESTELDNEALSKVAGGFSAVKTTSFSLLSKNQFIPGDMYKFMLFMGMM